MKSKSSFTRYRCSLHFRHRSDSRVKTNKQPKPSLTSWAFSMPVCAPKPCTECGVLVRDGTSRCAKHPRAAWVQKAPYKRESGRRLQEKRKALFSREPFCRVCALRGFLILAVIRDHIIPLAEGGEDVDENTQPVCRSCSDAKTEQERRRGGARSRRDDACSSTQGVGGVKDLWLSKRKPTA